jgi:cobalt-zinc-cadmium efflux system membrane fusion protein
MRTRQITILIVVFVGVVALALMSGCQGGDSEVEVASDVESHVCDHDHGSPDGEEEHAPESADAGQEGCDHSAASEEADPHEGHDHEAEGALVRLSERELVECGVSMAVAGPGWLEREVVIPGEVQINGDRLAHLVPRVPGIVTEVRKTLGDGVRAGEVLAVIESNELADARVDYLAARERLTLAESNFEREKNLWEKEITSEQEYLDAKSELSEARIEFRSSEQKLFALGLTEGQVGRLRADKDEAFTRYEVRAPFEGTVVDKHITLGEKVGDDSEIFVVADLSTVWIDLSITQKDFPYVREGVEATISAGYGVPDAVGSIDYVSPVVGEVTRTATARIVLANPDGLWRPGLFVSANLLVAETEVPVVIPRTAAQYLDEEWVVFVEQGDGFEPVPVTLGRGDEDRVEVVAGLRHGQRYVAAGAFECKAKVVTENIDPHAGHGH